MICNGNVNMTSKIVIKVSIYLQDDFHMKEELYNVVVDKGQTHSHTYGRRKIGLNDGSCDKYGNWFTYADGGDAIKLPQPITS